jgi:hypothetical protein
VYDRSTWRYAVNRKIIEVDVANVRRAVALAKKTVLRRRKRSGIRGSGRTVLDPDERGKGDHRQEEDQIRAGGGVAIPDLA